jgi:hypothetical protein
MPRALLVVAVVATLLSTLSGAEAAHRCQKKDCSDVVGDGLVKDNLGTSRDFTESHLDKLKEEQRLRRLDLQRKGFSLQ